MATFAFQMVAALSGRWLGLTHKGGTHGTALGQSAYINYFGDFRTIMALDTRWSNLSLLGPKEAKPGAREARSERNRGGEKEVGKRRKGVGKKWRRGKGKAIENGVEEKEC